MRLGLWCRGVEGWWVCAVEVGAWDCRSGDGLDDCFLVLFLVLSFFSLGLR
jgi:hypothetical protein